MRSGGDGTDVENEIAQLERMAGRGNFPGSTVGPPAVLKIQVTDNAGSQVWLIPPQWQWSASTPQAPLWRIAGIAWDKNPLRLPSGKRIRQKAVVTIWEYTPISLAVRSATVRSKSRNAFQVTAGKYYDPNVPANTYFHGFGGF